MLSTPIYSVALHGVTPEMITVEVDISRGLSNFIILGLPDKAIKESRDRIRAAIKKSGLPFPPCSVMVNLAPAFFEKEELLLDLPIALAILAESTQVRDEGNLLSRTVCIGELGLDGTVRPVDGVVPLLAAAYQAGMRRAIIPIQNVNEGALIKEMDVYGVTSLKEALSFVNGEFELAPTKRDFDAYAAQQSSLLCDVGSIKGQWEAKRALLCAAAGGHNLLFMGPPGSGKTLLARSLLSLLPRLTFAESIEVTSLYHSAGERALPLILERPFRSPHHTVSPAGLVGGGVVPRPGEMSLAHRGVLFLDELAEFSRQTLEVLRQPIESGSVSIARAQGTVTFPAQCILVAALNPCPCGYYGDPQRSCGCSVQAISRYLRKISGPLLDRIDIQVAVRAVSYDDAIAEQDAEMTSAKMRALIGQARDVRIARGQMIENAQLSQTDLAVWCRLESPAEGLLAQMFEVLQLSMRGYHKVLKLARTIADLAGSEVITEAHMYEAVQYRFFEKAYYQAGDPASLGIKKR